jgi:amidase
VLGGMIPSREPAWAGLVREKARARMQWLLSPARSCACRRPPFFRAPLRAQSLSGLDPLRDRITVLCAHGPLAGVPQVTILGTSVDGLPVGLTILGARGKDAALVAVARVLASV